MRRSSTLAAVGLTYFKCAAALGQACVGCTPIYDLGAGFYHGVHQGGLYPGNSNASASA